MVKHEDKVRIYIGTYTKTGSKGIYTLTLDNSNGKLEDLKIAGELDNPTYITLDCKNNRLFAVAKEGSNGGVASFSINTETGELTFINSQVSPGSPACHVSMNNDKDYLFSANYHTGEVRSYSVNEGGVLSNPISVKLHEGSGPNKDRQEKAHVHFVELTPDEKNLFAVDLGIDKVVSYSVDNGSLVYDSDTTITLPAGAGPRHLTFHPSMNFAYLLSELSSEVFVLEKSADDNSYKIKQQISALPENFDGESIAAAIHLSPDGKFLYTSNRGHDSIAVFSVDSNSGEVELKAITPVGGKGPRDFDLDPTGKFIVAANQDTNNLTLFSIDRVTGLLTKLEQEISIPTPVCVKFL
ncbi:lactonase family protein [Clostridium sp. YIM B02551]|uniref:lactonase family protein n=1 Tax=Clostridium sp. YIM B02551 TaxID=2910679 RepID=UPI001EEB38FA|nr:lactonase family protein [Clostridium sp. YIM B02551]